MKLSFKLLCLNFFIASVAGCQAQPAANYAEGLRGCLEANDIELLNSLTTKFEDHITKTYELTSTESYKRYLQSVATGNFPQNFFSYSSFEQDMNSFRNSEFYKKTWVNTSSFNKEHIV